MFARVFNAMDNRAESPFSRHIPMINSLTNSLSSYFAEYGQIRKKKGLMSWYKTVPELTALVNKVAKDIVTRWHFEPVRSGSNRNRIMQANKFAQEVALTKLMFSQVVDLLVTGDGFGWMGKVTDENIRVAIRKRIKSISSVSSGIISTKEAELLAERLLLEMKQESGLADTDGIDEDLLRPRKYRSVASSTMEIVYDQYDIGGYKQWVGMSQNNFTTEEIIHFTMMDVDGKVNGFTPVESMIVQLELLRNIWQNMLSLHRNGGVPDFIFSFKDMQPSDPMFEKLKDQIAKYRLVENKHGNLVFTGDVAVEALQQLDKMQFQDEGLYITGVMAMQWSIPRSAIPYIVGNANTKDDTGGNSDKDYGLNVEFFQKVYAETMNTQLWIPHFGVKLVFDKRYINSDIQEQAALQTKYNNLKLLSDMASRYQKSIRFDKFVSEIGLSEDDFEEAPEPIIDVNSTLNEQNPKSAMRSPAQQNNAEERRRQAVAVADSRGKPTGVGKESKFSGYPYVY